MCVYIYVYIYTYIYPVYVDTYIHTYIYPIHIPIRIYICIYMRSIHTHTHHTHTHTHTHAQSAYAHTEGAVLGVRFTNEDEGSDPGWGGEGGGGGADLCTMGKKHIKFWTLRPTLSAFGSSVENEFPYTLKARNGSFGVFNVLLMCC